MWSSRQAMTTLWVRGHLNSTLNGAASCQTSPPMDAESQNFVQLFERLEGSKFLKVRWKATNNAIGTSASISIFKSVELVTRRSSCICKSNKGEQMLIELSIDSKQLASEREEAKAIVIQYLKRTGLSTAVATRIVNKSGHFIAHLISILRTKYRTRYLTGRELTTLEVQNILLVYLESLAAEHGDGLVDILVHFPNSPPSKKECYKHASLDGTARKTVTVEHFQLHKFIVDGSLRPSLSYMLALGLTLEQVKSVVRRFPSIANCNPEKKIKPIVDLLVALGVSQSDLCKVFLKRPQIFACSLEENLRPTMVYLESLGLQRNQWARVLVACPALLTYSKAKIHNVVTFLYDLGLSSICVGKILTRFPHVVTYSVEDKLKPTANFLESVGVKNVGDFVRNSPQVLGYSIEGNIKPTIMFFLELDFSMEEVVTIITRYPNVVGLAIEKNLRPKWDYFVKTGWPKSQILAFPQYFGYSLKKRIRSRFEKVALNGRFWTVNRILSSSDKDFERDLNRENSG